MTSAQNDAWVGLLERLGRPTLNYDVGMSRWPEGLQSRFLRLGPDQSLTAYLERVVATRASRGRTWAQRVMCLAMSDFDANAWLGMYPMHLLGTEQARLLLPHASGGRLLDIGAGSGDVTAALQPLFEDVEVVEVSRGARKRLRERGYVCHGYDVARDGLRGGNYDVIALLNVLDRTDRPLTLLDRCHASMTPKTRLLLSMPLPYRPIVYAGAGSREPTERLPVVGNGFEAALLRFVQNVLVPKGFAVERFTRLPYLSGGDSACAMTVLDAAVFVCEIAPPSVPAV
jgi:SAM-dependent methyltransferase